MKFCSLKIRWGFFFLSLSLGIACVITPVAGAGENKNNPDFYQYTHKDGSTVFTDDPEKIPEEYRSSATRVKLPPLVTIPVSKTPPQAMGTSRVKKIKAWYGGLSPLGKIAVAGVLPVALISLWGFYFLGGRIQNPAAKLLLKLTMALIVAGSLYMLYFIFMRIQAEQMTRGLPIQIDTGAPPAEMLEPIRKGEEDRLRRIEEIADSP